MTSRRSQLGLRVELALGAGDAEREVVRGELREALRGRPTEAAAELLGVSARTLRRWRRLLGLPCRERGFARGQKYANDIEDLEEIDSAIEKST